jgi:hypothetical protein
MVGDKIVIMNVTILNEKGGDEYDGTKDAFEDAI